MRGYYVAFGMRIRRRTRLMCGIGRESEALVLPLTSLAFGICNLHWDLGGDVVSDGDSDGWVDGWFDLMLWEVGRVSVGVNYRCHDAAVGVSYKCWL